MIETIKVYLSKDEDCTKVVKCIESVDNNICTIIRYDYLPKDLQEVVEDIYEHIPCMEVQFSSGHFQRMTGDDVFTWLQDHATEIKKRIMSNTEEPAYPDEIQE